MKPTMEILARISKNSLENKEEIFTKLYRYLLRPDIFKDFSAVWQLLLGRNPWDTGRKTGS